MDVQPLLSRMAIIPRSPGGEPALIPVYACDALGAATFDVYFDPELNGQTVDDYLRDRARLLSCRYAVWLYRLGDGQPATAAQLTDPLLVIQPDKDGVFSLSVPAVSPGHAYGWQVVARITAGDGSGVELRSAPLFFCTAPSEATLPALLDLPQASVTDRLLRLAAEQARAQSALGANLGGMPPYSNYFLRSDVYLCVAVTGVDTCPRPDGAQEALLDSAQLSAMSGPTADLLRVQRGLQAGSAKASDTAPVAGEYYALLQRWAGGPNPPRGKAYAALVDQADRLRTAEPSLSTDQALAGLSQMLVAADQLIGPGTLDLRPGYEAGFLAYAASTSRRLGEVESLAGDLGHALSASEAASWLSLLRDERAELGAIALDVERGRLSRGQLSARLAKAATRFAAAQQAGESSYLEGATCGVDLERIKRLTPGDKPQLAKLASEVATCYLSRLAEGVWPHLE